MTRTALLYLFLFFWSGMALAEFTADATGGYNWGSYTAQNDEEETHSGAGLSIFTGYRLNLKNIGEIETGLTGVLSFPELGAQNPNNMPSFSFQAFGLEAGYLWHKRIEPLLQYYPYARLSQT